MRVAARRSARQIGARAFDRDADVARAADRARLVDRQPDPLDAELLEHQQRDAVRQRLDELELGRADVGDDALRDLLVVERVGDVVAFGGAPAVNRQFEVDDDLLPDAPLPVDEADQAFDLEAVQENAVAALCVRELWV